MDSNRLEKAKESTKSAYEEGKRFGWTPERMAAFVEAVRAENLARNPPPPPKKAKGQSILDV